ncbi:alpha/beta fold hydrolase [Flagellimonas sp. CMM7]|uniref:alpha/beta fold hydrolase n=1 Tax=Flagellimonas sp. CMM7 TaxID=2654676 RepID=UPI0013D852FF|nr:alpha/beta hydrolase [Flagellimonas sp. CMM7]UII81317.1 alpha/beta hydrolase [Flagellimonas sp. CMM7]
MILIRKPICALALLIVSVLHSQSQFIEIGKDSAAIYVEDFGKGKPVLFIPGWTMTTEFFSNQRDYFEDKFRYISYDPRSHGKSAKTRSGHTYKNHAIDLRGIIQKLNLKDVALVGWSSGSATIYEYVQLYGIEGLSHLVFIDEPPKWIGDNTDEWVYGTFEGYRESLKDLISDRKAYASSTVNWMTLKDLDSVQEHWMVNQMLMTPNDAALSLYIDGMASDYNEIVIGLNGKIPMLFMLRESWYDEGQSWLSNNVPQAKGVSIESHAAFWDNTDHFNTALESFIANKL